MRTNVVSHGYLDAMGVPLLHGRDFGPQDHAMSSRVAIVSQSLANRLWPNADPIGQSLTGVAQPLEVIGVVPDLVYASPLETERPGFFLSLLAQNYESAVTLHVRAAIDRIEVFPSIRRAVREVDQGLALTPPRRPEIWRPPGAGHFTAISLPHGRRPRTPPLLVGLPLGLAGTAVASGFLRNQLFAVEPFDPLIVLSVCMLFVASATLACILPSRRALSVDPAVVLK